VKLIDPRKMLRQMMNRREAWAFRHDSALSAVGVLIASHLMRNVLRTHKLKWPQKS
jgi:hypothetical protein